MESKLVLSKQPDNRSDQYVDIIEAFKDSLKNIHWMDHASAKAASEKVRIFL
jgi:hypothetical protein